MMSTEHSGMEMSGDAAVARLVLRAAEGDETAQRLLYEAHYAAALRLAYLLLQDISDAEDVVQDSFVYLFRNLNRYDPAHGTFLAWLRVTLVSRCRNRRRCSALRRRWQWMSLETLDAVAQDGDDPAGLLEHLGARRVVWEALQRLTHAARDALILRYYEELSYAEIGEILGCSEEAARARVAHGKAQLRRLLSPVGESLFDTPAVHPTKVG